MYEVADFILDNCVPEGDAAVEVEGMNQKICGMSSITTGVLLEATVYRAIEIMLEQGKEPLIYKSQNIDGGRELTKLLKQNISIDYIGFNTLKEKISKVIKIEEFSSIF